MLDVCIRIFAHVLTPLFLLGIAGSALLVVSKLGSDIAEFFQKDETEPSTNGRPSSRTPAV